MMSRLRTKDLSICMKGTANARCRVTTWQNLCPRRLQHMNRGQLALVKDALRRESKEASAVLTLQRRLAMLWEGQVIKGSRKVMAQQPSWGGDGTTVDEWVNSHILISARPNGPTESEGLCGETCLNAGVWAQIKLVDGRPLSPGIYQSLHLMGTKCSMGESVDLNLSLQINNL